MTADTAAEWEAAFRAADTPEKVRWLVAQAQARGQVVEAMCGLVRATVVCSTPSMESK